MAADSDVRLIERLRVVIGEAKNLPPRSHGSVEQRDVYCAIKLDQEEIFRTTTKEKTLNPFFSEDFQFEVPREFRYLSVYVAERERASNKDKVLGKVSIKKEGMHKFYGKDNWFPIMPVDADSEVQGKAHISVRLEPSTKSSIYGPCAKLVVRVTECSDLNLVNGSCNPYAQVTLCHGSTKQETRKSKVRRKTVCPRFEDTFFAFDLKPQRSDKQIRSIKDELSNLELRVCLQHDLSGVGGMFGSVFLGEVRIPVRDLGLERSCSHQAWYLLQPRSEGQRSPPTAMGPSSANGAAAVSLGSLRLKLFFTSDRVFSSHFYMDLRELLLMSPTIKPVTSSAAYLLGEMVQHKDDAAQPLVKIFKSHSSVLPLLRALASWEVAGATDPHTIFRGNTLVSKCVDEYMKLTGMLYLQDTLKTVVAKILTERLPCEIDPTRLKDGESLKVNEAHLRGYVGSALSAIVGSWVACPWELCDLFSMLRSLAADRFPGRKELQYSVISVFLFLRFFAAAILSPKLFELSSQPIDEQCHRTLTLVSKSIQTLGNLVSSTSAQPFYKEDYMKEFYENFITDEHKEAVRQYLELISLKNVPMRNLDTPSIVLKEGTMTKRAQGRNRLGLKNFKRRYFCLTTKELYYSKTKDSSPLCTIPLDEILGVEKVQEDSFKMKNVFQVIQKSRALYIQANNCVEEKEWRTILTRICHFNLCRIHTYHPAAFLKGHWLCCKEESETAPGCSPVTSYNLADIKVTIDTDREMQRVHSIFLNQMHIIERLIETCRQQLQGPAVPGVEFRLPPGFVVEDPASLLTTLSSIKTFVETMELKHERHRHHLYRQTQYGSKQAPIGDDNYLLMFARQQQQRTASVPSASSLARPLTSDLNIPLPPLPAPALPPSGSANGSLVSHMDVP
ncbi:ras GTPase activating protein 1 [Dermacentor variabilis]|uniref:ras GTPase activating protein 1 n=1 Tax=Dermacentor variabilis TaxID=34621 RepID=UPI003F5B3BA6